VVRWLWLDAPVTVRPLTLNETLTPILFAIWRASGKLLKLRLFDQINALHRDAAHGIGPGASAAWPLSLRLGEWCEIEDTLHEALFFRPLSPDNEIFRPERPESRPACAERLRTPSEPPTARKTAPGAEFGHSGPAFHPQFSRHQTAKRAHRARQTAVSPSPTGPAAASL
jgi:hypothetical protein